MISAVNSRVGSLLKQVVAWLVSGNYAEVEARSKGSRLSVNLMRQAIEECGRTLIMPPIEAFSNIDGIRVKNADTPTWSIRFDLWTREEGRSDLTLECTIAELGDGALDLEVDSIHVL